MNHILKYEIDLNGGNFGRVMQDAHGETSHLDSAVRNLKGTLAGAIGS